ncbi:hypothetical protein E2C01_099634 [Portunus trituberculatus]|uniref:Uncharacterized protein n=1 Tax=Portunus trituberculatus TaxID=210409 RepID=A0A5B7K0T6_PORTR|nr:hypothetical protein [Portunus trituberculatus]
MSEMALFYTSETSAEKAAPARHALSRPPRISQGSVERLLLCLTPRALGYVFCFSSMLFLTVMNLSYPNRSHLRHGV